MTSLGEKLKAERESRGISIDEVSDRLKISKKILQKIENDQNLDLPETIRKGFLRSYCRYLGLPEPLFDEPSIKVQTHDLNHKTEIKEKKSRFEFFNFSIIWLPVLIMMLLILISQLRSKPPLTLPLSNEKEQNSQHALKISNIVNQEENQLKSTDNLQSNEHISKTFGEDFVSTGSNNVNLESNQIHSSPQATESQIDQEIIKMSPTSDSMNNREIGSRKWILIVPKVSTKAEVQQSSQTSYFDLEKDKIYLIELQLPATLKGLTPQNSELIYQDRKLKTGWIENQITLKGTD